MTLSEKIATTLLQIKAIKLQPQHPFTWASGWLSPIYCDNRLTLSFPEVRTLLADSLCSLIRDRFSGIDGTIAAVATGAIPHGTLVADRLGWPLVYVRSAPKGHGLGNRVEGQLDASRPVIVVEDLVSTGKSSLEAVDALRQAGANVAGMVSIFTYGFSHAQQAFDKSACSLFPLTDYETVLRLAVKDGSIDENILRVLQNWRTSPETWKP